MDDPLYIVCCDNLRSELEAVIADHAYPLILRTYPALCEGSRINWEVLEATGLPAQGDFVIIGGGCLHGLEEWRVTPRHRIFQFETCFDFLLGKTQRRHLVMQGAYLLTPGWLRQWRAHLEEWGFERDTARSFFHESIRKLVLLETLHNPDATTELHAFAEFVDMPDETLPVGLELPQLWLHRLIVEHRMERERRESRNILAQATRATADNAMVMDLIGRLAVENDPRTAALHFLDLTVMLFVPRNAFFLSLRDGQIGELIAWPQPPPDPDTVTARLMAWAAGKETAAGIADFCLRIEHRGELFGLLELTDIQFGEYLSQYRETAQHLSKVAGLAIANARAYQRLNDTVKSLEAALVNVQVLQGLLPICASCKRIRDDSGYWNHLESYISTHSDVTFSHGICPECEKRLYPGLMGNAADRPAPPKNQ